MVSRQRLGELADAAPGSYVSDEKLSEIKGIISPEETPYYILESPAGGVNRIGDPEFRGGLSDMAKRWGDSRLHITNNRIIFTRKKYGTLRADHLPYENIVDFEISTGGLLSIGQIEIKTQEHTYRGPAHKRLGDERADEIVEFVTETSRDSPDRVEEELNSIEQMPPLWCHRVINAEILEDYGLSLSAGECRLSVSPGRLLFTTDEKTKKSERRVEISLSDVDFEGIETGSRRDFEAENKSRTKNLANPFRGPDSPTKKSRESIIRIPIVDSNHYVKVSPKSGSELDILLSVLSQSESGNQTPDGPSNHRKESDTGSSEPSGSSPLTILKRRLAKGEISPEEFEKRKNYLDE